MVVTASSARLYLVFFLSCSSNSHASLSYRLFVPKYMYVYIQCPTFKREADGTESPEPFAAEAKFFTESRLLQRDVQIILESCPNQVILGTILHPVRILTQKSDPSISQCRRVRSDGEVVRQKCFWILCKWKKWLWDSDELSQRVKIEDGL